MSTIFVEIFLVYLLTMMGGSFTIKIYGAKGGEYMSINNDVCRCESTACSKREECYRQISQSSLYDMDKVCTEEDNYKYFVRKLDSNIE